VEIKAMEIVNIDEKKIVGITTRTSNAAEMGGNGKILPLWEAFVQAVGENLPNITPIGVYWNYESDVNAAYDITAGIEKDSLDVAELSEEITIQAGRYLKFTKEGPMPDAVISLWQEIWVYFSTPNSEFKRAYTTDFEVYSNQSKVEIYIAIES
jgi:predicted transcriptional regulator YdeE